MLFPGLRLGYLVVPPPLSAAFVAARALADRGSPLLEQAALADFFAQGHFARHVRRMRTLYAARQQVLVAAARHDLGGLLDLPPAEAGMHLVGRLPAGVDDRAVARRAAACGVVVTALSSLALGPAPYPGLVLGYAATDEAEISAGVRCLRAALPAPGAPQ